MKITIVGGGNVGTQFAVHCSQKNDVTIFTSKPEDFIKDIIIVDENNNITLKGNDIKATNSKEEAFRNSDIIFITYPAFLMNDIANVLLPYIKEGMKIGIIPGTGGGECTFRNCINEGAIVFGLQRVPGVARLVERGKCVKVVGYRNELFVASLPHVLTNDISALIEDIFNIKCSVLPNYLNLTLTPSNPILHTTRLKTVFNDYYEGKYYNSLPLFYEDWNNETSELLFKCDNEVQEICKKLNMIDLSYVKSLRVHYESNTPSELTAKIRSIKGFKGLTIPSIQTKEGLIPDFNSRFFSADFPYGLSIIIQIGEFANVNVDNMKEVMRWYRKTINNLEEFSYRKFGINSLEDLLDFYSR